MPSGPQGSRRERAAAALLAVWAAVLPMAAGWLDTADQRVAALALAVLTAGAPALVSSKKTLRFHHSLRTPGRRPHLPLAMASAGRGAG